jgi:patatin-like phospholipase/acyl hydrolase
LTVFVSTGGIIALGLGVKQWTIDHCVTEFIRLCDQAFSPREFNNVAGLDVATTLAHGSKYKTTPLRDALFSTFGEAELYGGRRKAHCDYNIQVAVTATSGTGEEGLILANYSRHEENETNYKFEFPHNLQIWEAASATSAAPSFFKPFVCFDPHRTYLDGAIYYNNPVRVANHERKFLWPDVADNPPDILLSIGTGKNGQRMKEELQIELTDRSAIRQTKPNPGNWLIKWQQKLRSERSQHLKKEKPSTLVSKFFSVLVCTEPLFAPAMDMRIPWYRSSPLTGGLGKPNRQHLELGA